MGIQINWACNLDRAAALCLPKYSFRRLDPRDMNHNVSPCYNFRFAKYFKDLGGTGHRTLKAYGIRFNTIVFGKTGKLDIIPTMINIGPAGCRQLVTAAEAQEEKHGSVNASAGQE